MTNEEFSEWTTSDTDELFADFPDEYFEMLFTPVDFDVNNQYLTIRLTPAPSEPVGGGLVGTWYLTQSDIQLTVDSLVVERDDLRTNYFFEAHPKYWIPYGAIDTTLDVNGLAGWSFNSNPFWYPFDSYPFSMPVIVEQRPWSEASFGSSTTTEDLEGWAPIAARLRPYLVEQQGFTFDVRPSPYALPEEGTSRVNAVRNDWLDGLAAVDLHARRTLGIRMLVGLIALVMTLNLIALATIVLRVLRSHRPPSAQMLVWVAALAFATVAVRETMPFSPPPGIALDYILFFPTLALSGISTLLIGLSWSSRQDYVP